MKLIPAFTALVITFASLPTLADDAAARASEAAAKASAALQQGNYRGAARQFGLAYVLSKKKAYLASCKEAFAANMKADAIFRNGVITTGITAENYCITEGTDLAGTD